MNRCPRWGPRRHRIHIRRRGRRPARTDLDHIDSALSALRDALRQLNAAAAHRAAWAVRRAMTSAEGALRHATNMFHRTRSIPSEPITNQPLTPRGAAFDDRSSSR